MTIHCPKCHAGRGAIELRTENLEAGTVLQVVRCVLCSWRTEREVVVAAHANANRPKDAQTQTHTHTARRRGVSTQPCPIPGCGKGYYSIGGNPLGLCKKHANSMRQWEMSKKTRPAPFILVDGAWQINPERLAATAAAEAPAPAPVPAAKTPRRITRSSKWVDRCSGCKTVQPIAAWGLCLPCLDAEQKGATAHV